MGTDEGMGLEDGNLFGMRRTRSCAPPLFFVSFVVNQNQIIQEEPSRLRPVWGRVMGDAGMASGSVFRG